MDEGIDIQTTLETAKFYQKANKVQSQNADWKAVYRITHSLCVFYGSWSLFSV